MLFCDFGLFTSINVRYNCEFLIEMPGDSVVYGYKTQAFVSLHEAVQ